MMRVLTGCSRWLAISIVLAIATPASADVLSVFAEADGGAVDGKAIAGSPAIKNSAFFANAPHIDYGALVGVEVFSFLDGWIQHHQFTDGSRIATWTQFGLGLHLVNELGDIRQQKAHEGGFLELSGGGWFGVGTGQQVMPPLDNAQITDKALLLEGRVGLGKHLSEAFDLGISVPVSWGYFFKNGNGATVNDSSTHYRSVQAEALLYLRLNIHIL